MAGKGSQNKDNMEKIKREMASKRQKAEKQKTPKPKQEVKAAETENNSLMADSIGQAQDKPTKPAMKNKGKKLKAETEAEKDVKQDKQDIVDTKKIKFVVFRVEEEEFALKVSSVKEIIRIPQITSLPNLPEYVTGLCSLRGSLLPVVDCRILFGMPKQDFNQNSRIIITDIQGKQVGLISDKVLEVIDVEETAVKEPPASFKGINGGSLDGIVILDEGKRVVMILDADKMIEVEGIDKALKQHSESSDNIVYSEAGDEEEQIVIFSVGAGEYAFSINCVREIIRLPEVVKVPNTADYVEGVFSLRNELLAVINMGKLLGMNDQQPHEQSRVIIINNGNYSYGAIVDKVSNVIQVQKKLLKGDTQDSKLIKGIYNLNEGSRLIMMLEPEKLISLEEVEGILKADQKQAKKDEALSSSEMENINEYVVFKLGGEEYGIRIQNVQEVNRINDITHFPGAPDCIEGMVDLRGEIMPILNLRKMFGLDRLEDYRESKFIVVELEEKKIGILVDLVTGVMRFTEDNLEAAPDTLKEKDKDSYIDKIAKLNGGKRIIMLLNLYTILSFM